MVYLLGGVVCLFFCFKLFHGSHKTHNSTDTHTHNNRHPRLTCNIFVNNIYHQCPHYITEMIFQNHSASAAKSLQSCLTLCDPTDGSPPGSPIPGILQARTLEWVAISCSNIWK